MDDRIHPKKPKICSCLCNKGGRDLTLQEARRKSHHFLLDKEVEVVIRVDSLKEAAFKLHLTGGKDFGTE